MAHALHSAYNDAASRDTRQPAGAREWAETARSASRAAGGADFTAADVWRAALMAKRNKAPSPADGLRIEAVQLGGSALAEALAIVFALVARGVAAGL